MKSLVLCSALLLVLPLFLCAQSRQPLIAVGGISHESNSFNPAKTQLDDFSRRKTATVDEVLEEWSKSSDIVSGYVEGARRFGLKLHPTLVAAASPKGIVTDAAFNALMAELIRQLKALPVTLEMRDHLRQEKTGDLPLALPEAARQQEFSSGTLGLWGPDHFVIYYRSGRVPNPGIVILGQVTGDVSIFDRPGPVQVRVERLD